MLVSRGHDQSGRSTFLLTLVPADRLRFYLRSRSEQGKDTAREGVTLVHEEGNRAGQATGDRCHGEGNDHEWQRRGLGGTIRTGAVMPPTVLVTETDTGALIVQGRPDGLRVYLSPGEAVALRRELATAIGSAQQGPDDGRGDRW